MLVILTQDIKGLGFKNEVKEVKRGYYMNFLLPQGYARIADQAGLRKLQAVRAKEAMSVEEMKSKSSEIADKISGKTLKITAKADAGKGTLFGSIGESDIAEKINAEYLLSLKPRQIVMKEHLKHVGEYTVTVRLSDDIEASVKVSVEAE